MSVLINGELHEASFEVVEFIHGLHDEIANLRTELAEVRANNLDLHETSVGLCKWIDKLNGERVSDRWMQSKQIQELTKKAKAAVEEARRDRDTVFIVNDSLFQSNDALMAELEWLRGIIERAPHDPLCSSHGGLGSCDCWKRDAEDNNND